MKQSQKALNIVVAAWAGLVVASVALSSVSAKLDSGEPIKSGSEDLTDFNRIEIHGLWQVNVVQGEEWQVSWFNTDKQGAPASKDIHDEIKVYVDDETLTLKRKKGHNWWEDQGSNLRAEIVMPELRDMDIAGGAQIDISGFEGEKLDIDIAGAVQLKGLDGHFETLDLDAAGASDINLVGIAVKDAEVDIAGASDVKLTMDGGTLSGSLAGAGQILYYGDVSEENVSVAGFGVVNRGK